MKIITYEAMDDGNFGEETGVILRKLEQLVNDHHYVLSKGWRFILKMQYAGEDKPYFHIDVQSDIGGGSYAEAKMSTLERFPEAAATGDNCEYELHEVLIGWEDSDKYKEILSLGSIELLTDDMWTWLRDEISFAPCYGGVRIPYKDKIVKGGAIEDISGETRIAFSGASSEQDLFFALMIFRSLNSSLARIYPNVQSSLDLSRLKEVPAVRFWLDLLDIKEA